MRKRKKFRSYTYVDHESRMLGLVRRHLHRFCVSVIQCSLSGAKQFPDRLLWPSKTLWTGWCTSCIQVCSFLPHCFWKCNGIFSLSSERFKSIGSQTLNTDFNQQIEVTNCLILLYSVGRLINNLRCGFKCKTEIELAYLERCLLIFQNVSIENPFETEVIIENVESISTCKWCVRRTVWNTVRGSQW